MTKTKPTRRATSTRATLTTLPTISGRNGDRAKSQCIAVAVADHQELVRMGLRLLLQFSEKVEVTGEAADGHAAVALVEKRKPAILLTEVEMPQLHGFDVLSALKSSATKVIIVSSVEDELTIAECLRLGAMGYVLKGSSFDEVEHAIEAALNGEIYLCAEATRIMMRATLDVLQNAGNKIALSKRELVVMQLAANGKTSSEIAPALFISRRTAEAHRANAMKKLGLHTQTELVHYALKRKWLTP